MKNLLRIGALALMLALLFTSCNNNTNSKLKPGEGYISTPQGKIWYRVVGEGPGIPIMLLHGGPGVPSYYLNPLAALGKNRPVIFFDQLGCGRSFVKMDTASLTVDNFVEQVEQVKQYFGLKDYYLYGQSWGTMLGTDYYLKHPEGIKALILSSAALSIPKWLADADTLIATLPDTIQEAINTNEKNKTYDNPAYQNAVKVYYEHFVARKVPWSADVDSAFKQLGTVVYTYMGGPSEFTMTGPLKDYDRTNRLGEIKVPTLFICGEYDEARPSTIQYYHSLVPGSKFVQIPNAGHMTMQDNPEADLKAINSFLDDLEKK